MLTKEEILAELTLKEVPASIISEAIAAHEAKSKTTARVEELTQEVADRDGQINDLTETISGFQVAEFERAVDVKIDGLIDWQVTGEDATNKVDSLKRTLRSRVVAELGDKRDTASIETVTAEVWTDLQPLAEMVRDALAGPAAAIGGKRTKRENFDASPAAQENARSDWNM